AVSSASALPRAIGRYSLFGIIASGRLASIHLARARGTGGFSRIVAVKRLRAPFARSNEFVSMMLDEARLVARIRHPNVVPVLDVSSDGDELLVVMEYVHGESLARLSRADDAPVPLALAVAIIAGALRGLHAAHLAKNERGKPLGVVHRAVCPE